MRFDVSPEELKRAKWPHDLFLINLIANHILLFVVTIGMFAHYPWPVVAVPVISIVTIVYTLWRGRRSLTIDPWYVKCHWQVCLKRTYTFLLMFGVLVAVSGLGAVGHFFFGMRTVTVYALIGGAGLLPVMVTILVLIVMESDALHLAGRGQLPRWIVERFPNPGVKEIELPGAASAAAVETAG